MVGAVILVGGTMPIDQFSRQYFCLINTNGIIHVNRQASCCYMYVYNSKAGIVQIAS